MSKIDACESAVAGAGELSRRNRTNKKVIEGVMGWNALRLAAIGLALAAALPAHAQTLTVLHTFGSSPDGAYPQAGLLRDSAGNLYGTTSYGGDANNGTVFEIDSQGEETILHSFGAAGDGTNPTAALAEDAQGNLYGTTEYGGTGSCTLGCGTVFKVTSAGIETVLHSFNSNIKLDGNYPQAGVILDAEGNLYGTTLEGGTGGCNQGCGTVYKVTSARVETVLHSFDGGASGGNYPSGGLVLDAAGNLYGTTALGGGLGCGQIGCGLVFKLSPNGKQWAETVLHRFRGEPKDGNYPLAALTLDSAGNLYGTTFFGGANLDGTVFKVTPAGTETLLVSFDWTNGVHPQSALVQDAAGNFYGTTNHGPDQTGCDDEGCGTVFKVTPAGVESVYFPFPDSGDDGQFPQSVILDSAGNLYGTCYESWAAQYAGNVFEIQP